MPDRPPSGDRGQAMVEAVAGTSVILLAALVCLQLFAVGYSLSVADGAAQAAAVAIARGDSPERAVRRAVPGWAEAGARFTRVGPRVRVSISPPSPVPGLGGLLSVGRTAWMGGSSRG